MKVRREGGVGDIVQGLLGVDYQERFEEFIGFILKNATAEKVYDNVVTLTCPVGAIPMQMVSVMDAGKKRSLFRSVFPLFPRCYDCVPFTADEIDEWKNGFEAVLNGTIHGGRLFSFFCQNYMEVKAALRVNETFPVTFTVLGTHCRIVPPEKRMHVVDAGPLKGETLDFASMRYLNPQTECDPEVCGFMFPILEIQSIPFFDGDIYKIKGSIPDNDGKDRFFDVVVHPSNIGKRELLKVGELFAGQGWLQGEVQCI